MDIFPMTVKVSTTSRGKLSDSLSRRERVQHEHVMGIPYTTNGLGEFNEVNHPLRKIAGKKAVMLTSRKMLVLLNLNIN